MASIPAFLARTSPWAFALLLITDTTLAWSSPESQASRIACKLEPLPEISTTSREGEAIIYSVFTCILVYLVLVMKKSQARKDHGHSVSITSGNDIFIPVGAARLENVFHSTFRGA